MRRHVVFLSVAPSTKSTKFDNSYLVDRLMERDETGQIGSAALATYH